jgi:hypothetical protein
MGWNHRKPATEAPEGQPLLLPMHDFDPDPDLNGYFCRCQLPRQNRHHNDAFLGPAPYFPHHPSTDDSPFKPINRPCDYCGAAPGEPCQRDGKPMTGLLSMHPTRRDAWIHDIGMADYGRIPDDDEQGGHIAPW